MTDAEKLHFKQMKKEYYQLCNERGFDELFARITCGALCWKELNFNPRWKALEQFMDMVRTSSPEQEQDLLDFAFFELCGFEEDS